jgi:hypothetical protein
MLRAAALLLLLLVMLLIVSGHGLLLRAVPQCAQLPSRRASRLIRCALPRHAVRGPLGWGNRGSRPMCRASPDRLTEEALECLADLVGADARLVVETARTRPDQALDLAREAWERRVPLLVWTAKYNLDKARLELSDAVGNSTLFRAIAPPSARADLRWERELVDVELSHQRTRLRSALLALRPALSTRLLQNMREAPLRRALLPWISPSALAGLVASGVFKLRWQANIWAQPLLPPAQFEATRASLVADWLAMLVQAHRRLDAEEDAAAEAASGSPIYRAAPPRPVTPSPWTPPSSMYTPRGAMRSSGRRRGRRTGGGAAAQGAPRERRRAFLDPKELKRGAIPVQVTEDEPADEEPRVRGRLLLSWSLFSPLAVLRRQISSSGAELATQLAYAPWRRAQFALRLMARFGALCASSVQRCGWKARDAMRWMSQRG